MLDRIYTHRKRRTSLRRFEIDTLLPIDDCLVRLTGRHPPFDKRERIARPHPFPGQVDAETISIVTNEPYELAGDVSTLADGTRFTLSLSYVEDSLIGFATSLYGAILIAVIGWNLELTGLSRSEAIFIATCGIAGVMLMIFLDRWLTRRRVNSWHASAPDIERTVQILTNLVLATDVREIPIGGTAPGNRATREQGHSS